tara:strand:- start:742 stop:936 length:195 start_codon:yes stop_codon:yes gene_type:complete
MIDIKIMKEFLKKQQERNLLLAEASRLIGFDITFSNDEMLTYAEEEFAEYVEKEIVKEATAWMK